MAKSNLIFLSFLLFFFAHSAFAQETLSGTVFGSDDNSPLIGASIVAVPTNSGTITDIDGKFTVKIEDASELQISYIGYTSKSIAINDQNLALSNEGNLNIYLEPADAILDDVVIIGYGRVKKSDLTGSVSSVKAEELTKVPNSNALQSLQGKVSGLSVLSASGDPGSSPIVRLRGITTLNNNNPIVVIDGIISDVSTMNSINANDIESVEVLKDASSTAIYGSRGAAGVIIVTTKKGNSLENKISASIEQSIESVANQIDLMNGREFATYVNEIEPGSYNNLDVLPNTNWQDLVFQNNSPITNANLSASGATETASYYLGLGYFNQTGIIPKSGLNRYTAKLNTAFDLSKRIELGFDLTLALNQKENAPGVIGTSLRAWPIDVPYNEDGSFAEVNGGNPLAAIEYTNSNSNRISSLGNVYSSFKFTENLNFKTSFQYDFNSFKSKSFTPLYFVSPLQQSETNSLTVGYGNGQTLIWENILNYNNSFGKHGIDAIAGYTAQSFENETISGFTRNLLREDPNFWYLTAGDNEFETVDNFSEKNTILSYLSRVNYTFDSRYLVTATFRRDGSSKFGPNNKYGNFPSFALGWNVSNEDFFPVDSPLNLLKLRASWGIIGNERISWRSQYALVESGFNAVFGVDENVLTGATLSGGGNPDLKWEETRQTDIGAEMGFFDNRVIAEFDYYFKNTNDILVSLEPAGYTGVGAFQRIVYNAANVTNSGFEWNLNYRSDASKDFNYQIGFLGSTVNNKVTNIGANIGADSTIVGGDLGNGQRVALSSVGQPIGYFYGYNVVGVFQNQAELEGSPQLNVGQEVGDLKYEDINNDGVINGDDRTQIGSSVPNIIFGFNLNFNYKNFSLNADIQGQQGNQIYNGKQPIRFALLNYEDRYNYRWTGEGSTNEHFKASSGGNNFLPSSYFVEDGSFARLRSVTLSYNLPDRLLSRINMTNARIYLRGTNLYTLTKFSGYSPDIGASNPISGVIDLGSYPITRVFTLGASVGL